MTGPAVLQLGTSAVLQLGSQAVVALAGAAVVTLLLVAIGGVLFATLRGRLPWHEPSAKSPEDGVRKGGPDEEWDYY